MGALLNVGEVVEFAVRIEQHGYKFYVETMKRLNDERILELFQFLADEEFKHEGIFKNLLKRVGSFTPHESYPGEHDAYMKGFLKSHILGPIDSLRDAVESIDSLERAVALALEFERNSIVFFTSLKRYLEEKDREVVEKIIQEELNHIVKISGFRLELNEAEL